MLEYSKDYIIEERLWVYLVIECCLTNEGKCKSPFEDNQSSKKQENIYFLSLRLKNTYIYA